MKDELLEAFKTSLVKIQKTFGVSNLISYYISVATVDHLINNKVITLDQITSTFSKGELGNNFELPILMNLLSTITPCPICKKSKTHRKYCGLGLTLKQLNTQWTNLSKA